MPEQEPLRLVMSSCHLNDRESLITSIEHTRNLGFWGMEIFGREIVSGDLTEAHALDEVRNCAQQHGLALTVHPWFEWDQLPEDEAASEFRALLKRCEHLGAQFVNVHLNFFATPAQGVERVANIMRCLEDELNSVSYILCFENVPDSLPNPLGAHPEEFARFFNLVQGIPSIALTIDTGHAHMSGNLAAFVSQFPTQWAYTHLADNFGERDEHLGPGMGSIDWDEFAKGLVASGYRGPLIAEFSERFLIDSEKTLVRAFGLANREWPRLNLAP